MHGTDEQTDPLLSDLERVQGPGVGHDQQMTSTEWDLDSDEIASVTSDDLHANRPNRWRGPPSSWRMLTQEERQLWRAMEQQQSQDLSVHLYDAFALKRAARRRREQGGKQKWDGDESWMPPKAWTAWPLEEKQVPREGLMKRIDDEDERFSMRRPETRLPGSELHEELAATVLRLAKERFRASRRRAQATDDAGEAEAESHTDTMAEERWPAFRPRDATTDPDRSMAVEGSRSDEKDEEDEDEAGKNRLGRRTRQQTARAYEAVESANDDLSYQLLNPVVRHLLAQLDTTLTVMHNARVAGLYNLSGSSTASDSDQKAGRRRHGRSRKVHQPRPGEMADASGQRIACESDQHPSPDQVRSRDAAFEAWLREGDATPVRTGDEDEAGGGNIMTKLRRWGLRDWSDVVGAAALAGFPESVVRRTARRCADLFAETMVLRRLDERPAARGAHSADFVCRPRGFCSSAGSSRGAEAEASSLDDQSSEPADVSLSQRRLASLMAAPPLAGRRSGSGSRSCSRSRSSAGLLFCPEAQCARAARGFDRAANLQRHLRRVHPDRAVADADGSSSTDEALGAVRVDGFLRTMAVPHGWRARDARPRRRTAPSDDEDGGGQDGCGHPSDGARGPRRRGRKRDRRQGQPA